MVGTEEGTRFPGTLPLRSQGLDGTENSTPEALPRGANCSKTRVLRK